MQYNILKHKDTPSKKKQNTSYIICLTRYWLSFRQKCQAWKYSLIKASLIGDRYSNLQGKLRGRLIHTYDEKISILSNKKTHWIKLSLYSHFGFIGLPEASVAFVILRVARTVTIDEKIYKASSYYEHSSAQLINAYRV